MSFVFKFSQLKSYQILLKSVNIWLSNQKSKKSELFETQCVKECNTNLHPISHSFQVIA